MKYERFELLVAEERRLVVALRVRGDGAQDGLQVLDSHPEHGQLVEFAGHGVAHGNHCGKLGYVRVHFVPPPFLDLAVILSGKNNEGETFFFFWNSVFFFRSDFRNFGDPLEISSKHFLGIFLKSDRNFLRIFWMYFR